MHFNHLSVLGLDNNILCILTIFSSYDYTILYMKKKVIKRLEYLNIVTIFSSWLYNNISVKHHNIQLYTCQKSDNIWHCNYLFVTILDSIKYMQKDLNILIIIFKQYFFIIISYNNVHLKHHNINHVTIAEF